MPRYRFYNISGYVEVTAINSDDAKKKLQHPVHNSPQAWCHVHGDDTFTFVTAWGEPIEDIPLRKGGK